MPHNTSVSLGEHCDKFLSNSVQTGRYDNKSQAIRKAVKLLEKHDERMDILRAELAESESQMLNGQYTDGPEYMKKFVG